MSNHIHRFLLETLDIRGAHLQLNSSWQAIIRGVSYPVTVQSCLGELAAITALLANNLKNTARLTYQLRGDGEINLLVIDCHSQTDGPLNLRGYASLNETAREFSSNPKQLLGDGQLLMTLDSADLVRPMQSYVPLSGDTMAQIFEHYLAQSEQQPTWLMLYANAQGAGGLMLQKLPGADTRDADGWTRTCHLAHTIKPAELLTLDSETLLTRLFHQESVRLYPARTVIHHFPPDRDKIITVLRGLGAEEIERILAEHGEVLIRDDLSNLDYRFSAEEARALFAPPTANQ